MRLSGAAGVDLLEHLLELLRFGKFLLRDRMDGGFQAFAINLAVHGYPAVKSPRADVSQQVASVAQLVEQLTLNQLVLGSSPSRGTIFPMENAGVCDGRTNSAQNLPESDNRKLKFPKLIRHRKAEAKIYGKSKSYPFYRVASYVEFCAEHGWAALTRNKFGQVIGDVVARQYGMTVRHDILEKFHSQPMKSLAGANMVFHPSNSAPGLRQKCPKLLELLESVGVELHSER